MKIINKCKEFFFWVCVFVLFVNIFILYRLNNCKNNILIESKDV